MTDSLQFDSAEQTGPISCKACGTALPDQYYVVNGNIVCENCRRSVEEEWNRGGAAGRLGKAIGLGILAMIACAIVWYLVIKWTNSEWGILAIVVGLVVGGAVRKGSNGRGGWRYQALAIVLTYTAIVSSYIPLIVEQGFQVTVPALGLVFAMPFLAGLQNLLGILIIGFALFEAWKLNQRTELHVSGPHRVSASSAPA